MTSDVKADLKIELSDLNYLCSHASLACKCSPEMIATTTGPIMIHRPACFATGKNQGNSYTADGSMEDSPLVKTKSHRHYIEVAA